MSEARAAEARQPLLRQVTGETAAGAVAFAAVGGLAADNGGFFPTTWGWASVGLGAVAVVLLASGRPRRLRPVEKLVLGAVGGLAAWTFLSSAWSMSVTRSMLEGERSLVYVGAVAVVLLLRRPAGGRAVVVGTWLAVTAVCTYSVITRLFPRQFGVFDLVAGNRLSTPIGYWNGLGLFAAIGCLLSLGLAARASAWVRAAAAASMVVLVLTLYFTFGRGAWIALAAGLVAAVAADRRRLQLVAWGLVVAPWSALAVFDASRAHALTNSGSSIGAAQKDGHAVAVVCVFLVAVAALAALAADTIESRGRLPVGPKARRIFVAVIAALLLAALGAALARYGSPVRIARDAWHSFTTPPPNTGTSLNSRLFHLSGGARIDHWRVAEREISAHPWLGSGAGTFGEYWFQYRPFALIVHDAHNVYLETLAEIGPVGLALLVLLLAGLIAGAARSRSPFAGAAVGACVAYAFHAAAEWDWELPALLLAALFPALAVVEPAPDREALRRRFLPAAAAAAVGGFALVALLGNIALARSGNAADATHWRRAESEAQTALDLAPWSAEPLRKLAVAQGGLGDIAGAEASLREAVAMEPRDWSLWYQLSEVSTGALARHALVEADRLDPQRSSEDATPGDLRLVVIP